MSDGMRIHQLDAGSSMCWYAIQTKSRQEFVAEMHLNNQGFETFLPTVKGVSKRGDKKKQKIEAFFPGYLFITLDLKNQNTSTIRSTKGVVQLVRHGSCVLPVPGSVISELQSLRDQHSGVIDLSETFKPGQSVVITDGAMAGMGAVFKARSSQERVIVLLNILGAQTEASVSRHSLAKAG